MQSGVRFECLYICDALRFDLNLRVFELDVSSHTRHLLVLELYDKLATGVDEGVIEVIREGLIRELLGVHPVD